jgi:hypothetical protein
MDVVDSNSTNENQNANTHVTHVTKPVHTVTAAEPAVNTHIKEVKCPVTSSNYANRIAVNHTIVVKQHEESSISHAPKTIPTKVVTEDINHHKVN